jgi:hypothetical protein
VTSSTSETASEESSVRPRKYRCDVSLYNFICIITSPQDVSVSISNVRRASGAPDVYKMRVNVHNKRDMTADGVSVYVSPFPHMLQPGRDMNPSFTCNKLSRTPNYAACLSWNACRLSSRRRSPMWRSSRAGDG